MWICANDGFVSAVEDRYDPTMLVVRARRREHLVAIFGELGEEFISMKDSDYKWRLWIPKAKFAGIITQRIMGIDYDNFKSSVGDDRLHTFYNRVWYNGLQMQNDTDQS